MSDVPCCPKKFYYKSDTSSPSSPSAYHGNSGTWVGGFPGFGWVVTDGSFSYVLNNYPGDGGASPVARTHDGSHWFLYFSSASTYDPPRTTQTGVYSLQLRQVGPIGTGLYKVIEMIQDFGLVVTNEFATTTYGDMLPRAIDWSPQDDCLYVLLETRTSNHIDVPVSPGPDTIYKLLKVQFDGSYSVLWTHNNGSVTGAIHLAVAADGAVWITTPKAGFSGFQVVWRKPHGSNTVSQVTLDTDYPIYSLGIGATSWNAVLMYYQPPSTVYEVLLLVSPDGTTKPFTCDILSTRGFLTPGGFMRTEDFATLFVHMSNRIYQIDWKKCGSGWTVGGMAIAGSPAT